jgi:hypothetical protein
MICMVDITSSNLNSQQDGDLDWSREENWRMVASAPGRKSIGSGYAC